MNYTEVVVLPTNQSTSITYFEDFIVKAAETECYVGLDCPICRHEKRKNRIKRWPFPNRKET